MQHLVECQPLGPLHVHQEADHPEEQKDNDNSVPDPQTHGTGRVRHGEQADQEAGDEEPDRGDADHHRIDGEEDGIDRTGPLELVDAEPPPEPEERAQVFQVHVAASSQLMVGAATASAPASWINRFSRVSPWRIFSMDACSTSAPFTMIPTWVQSRSTISSTWDVRKTVDPRAT